MGSWIIAVDSTSEHRYGDARLESSTVHLTVDTSGHSADDDESRSRQLAREKARHRPAVRRARASTDHGDCRLGENVVTPTTSNEERRRRIVDRRQQSRVSGVAPPEPANLRHAGIR